MIKFLELAIKSFILFEFKIKSNYIDVLKHRTFPLTSSHNSQQLKTSKKCKNTWNKFRTIKWNDFAMAYKCVENICDKRFLCQRDLLNVPNVLFASYFFEYISSSAAIFSAVLSLVETDGKMFVEFS